MNILSERSFVPLLNRPFLKSNFNFLMECIPLKEKLHIHSFNHYALNVQNEAVNVLDEVARNTQQGHFPLCPCKLNFLFPLPLQVLLFQFPVLLNWSLIRTENSIAVNEGVCNPTVHETLHVLNNSDRCPEFEREWVAEELQRSVIVEAHWAKMSAAFNNPFGRAR